MTTAKEITAKNLDSYVGEKVTIADGMFSVSPWGYKMPTTSSRFGLADAPTGVYTITAKNPESAEEGAAVAYTLTANE